MGISISNSDNNKQIQLIRQHKKLKRKEIIAQELIKAPPRSRSLSLKEENRSHNLPYSSALHRRLSKKSESGVQEAEAVLSLEQKELQISNRKIELQALAEIQKSMKSLGKDQPIYEQKQTWQMSKGEEMLNPAQNMAQKKTDRIEQNGSLPHPLKQKPQPNFSDESVAIGVKRAQNKSWRGSLLPKQLQKVSIKREKDDMKISMKIVEFNYVDQTVAEEDLDKEPFNKKDTLAAKNLVLINKFAEHFHGLGEWKNVQTPARKRLLPNSHPVLNPILLDEILAYARTLENVVPANGISNL